MEVEKLRRDYPVEIDWRPFFLRPETPPEGLPLPPFIRERQKDPNSPIKRRAAAAGLKMVPRELIPSTRRAHEAAELARERGRLEPFQAALLRRYWGEAQDLYALDVLRDAGAEAGLDPDEVQRAVEDGRYREVVEAQVEEAHSLGISSIPTFLIGDQLAIQGAQEYDVFKLAMERLGIAPRQG